MHACVCVLTEVGAFLGVPKIPVCAPGSSLSSPTMPGNFQECHKQKENKLPPDWLYTHLKVFPTESHSKVYKSIGQCVPRSAFSLAPFFAQLWQWPDLLVHTMIKAIVFPSQRNGIGLLSSLRTEQLSSEQKVPLSAKYLVSHLLSWARNTEAQDPPALDNDNNPNWQPPSTCYVLGTRPSLWSFEAERWC